MRFVTWRLRSFEEFIMRMEKLRGVFVQQSISGKSARSEEMDAMDFWRMHIRQKSTKKHLNYPLRNLLTQNWSPVSRNR